MARRAALAAAVLALLPSGSGDAATTSRVLWQGPVLGAGGVLWSEQTAATPAIRAWTAARGDRTIYRSEALALGRPLVVGGGLLAFSRSFPGCAPTPGLVCPQAEEVLVGRPGGSFRRLVPPRTCGLPGAGDLVALGEGFAAYVDVDCARNSFAFVARRLSLARGGPVAGRPVVLAGSSAGACCPAVAAAGRFVAWTDGRRAEVTVYDLGARRVVYRARVGLPGSAVDLGFDVQRDGTLAIAWRQTEVAKAGETTLVWFSPASPRPHALPLRGRDTRIRIADDRIAFLRALSPSATALAVTDLRGRTHTIARFAPPLRPRSGFDFDGRRLTWAADRVDARRTDCPPPGQGRPCVLRETGTTTIRLAAFDGGTPRVVAQLPFDDVLARGTRSARYSGT